MKKKYLLPLTFSFLTLAFSAANSQAQSSSADTSNKPTWPTTFTLGFGGGINDTWNGGSQYSPFSPPTYIWTQSVSVISPYFHILAEIPIATNLMLAPRIAYEGYNIKSNLASSGPPTLAAFNPPLSLSIADIGADILLKYSFSDLHVMGGVNLGLPLHTNYDTTSGKTNPTAIPNGAGFAAAVKAGLGYDIPLNSNNTIWLTPEAFFTYSLTDYQSAHDNMSLMPVAVSGGLSLKFALSSPPPPPPPAPTPITATITAHGIMPDGSRAPEPVTPEQATHTLSSLPLLPYVFFEDNSAVIPSRYNRSGAMGFSEESALDGKDPLAANHDVLDIVGLRMKNNPSMTVRLVGTNSNSRDERNNIELSKARATAVADYLENTWAIDPSRITIDQRNLPELPTNPVTKAGMAENRRVEIISNDASLTAPVKLDKKESQSVGQTEISYDISVSPDPSTHKYSSWTIALDKNGVPLGTPMSGTGAPPSNTTSEIPNAQDYLDQPVHYTLTVTDANGQTAHADGLTKIEAKTVDHNNYEKYSMLSFDFDRSEINARARQMLELIGESINGGATGVKIDGYCDSTGTREYNQVLSESRANSAANVLKGMTSLPANITIEGHGIDDPKFPNYLPEGRQLNRRVEFTIEK